MARQLRHTQSGWHHVTNRGLDRQAIFRCLDDRVDFGRMLASGHDRFGVDVVAYCLMDNHYHLVLACPSGGLSMFMQHVAGTYTRHLNERHGGDGPIFRSRFFSRPILSEPYLLNAVRYVHRNPRDIRPPVRLDQYRWSSHRSYVGLRTVPPWLTLSPVLDWFESPAAFHEFVIDGVEQAQHITADVEQVIRACETVLDEWSVELGQARQGVLRTTLYLLLDRATAATRAALVQYLSPVSEAARDQAIRRARRTVQREPMYAAILDRVADLIVPAFTLCQTQRERQGSQAGRLDS